VSILLLTSQVILTLVTRVVRRLEEYFGSILVWDDGLVTGLPVGGADFTVLVSVLEGFDKSQGLVDTSTDCGVVDLHCFQCTLGIDDEEASESCAEELVFWVLDEDVVVSGHALANVGEEREVDFAETTFVSRSLNPGEMCEVRVCGHAKNCGVDVFEFLHLFRVRNQFGWANVREVEWVENQHDVFALEIVEGDLDEFTVANGVDCFEIRGLVAWSEGRTERTNDCGYGCE